MGRETVIKGGTVTDPCSGTSGKKDIIIRDGLIAAIYDPDNEEIQSFSDEEEPVVIDATGLVVSAGLVDPHVHFRDPGQTYKEDILTGAAAAAAGGYTSVIMMGNTNPHPDTPETISYMLEKGRETGIRVYACGNVTVGMHGKELTDMARLKAAGAVIFTDDGLPLTDAEVMRKACETAASLDMMISLHEEDPRFVYDAGINAGETAKKLNLRGADRQAEISMVKRDIEIAGKSGCSITIQHISARETVELIRQAKKEGVNVHAEASPHHFTLTEEAVLKHGTLAKMNPPLREEADRLSIIEGIADGTIEMIATDHAPHSAEEKEREFTKAPSGITGLETALSLGIRELVRPGYITLETLLNRMSYAPAKIAGIPGGKLKQGESADIVIFDPDAERVVSKFFSKSANSPFKGETLPGIVKMTICGGNIVNPHFSAAYLQADMLLKKRD